MAYNFAKATVVETPEGEKSASVSCINGDSPSSSTSYTLSASMTYYDGEDISIGDVILFPIHASTNTLDDSFIFPYSTTTGDPYRIGGGIGKGNIIEEDESTTNLGVDVDWINGINASGVISEIGDGALGSLGAGDTVWFLMIIDANDVPEVLSATLNEGVCGDPGQGEPAVFFGASVPAGN